MNHWEQAHQLTHSCWIDALTEAWHPDTVSLGLPQTRAPRIETADGKKLVGRFIELSIDNAAGGVELWASPLIELEEIAETFQVLAVSESEKRKLSAYVRFSKPRVSLLPDVPVVFTRPTGAQIWYPAHPSRSSLDDSAVWLGYFQFSK